MKNTINILSDNVINQIAAGEVIKRPASIIKELIENAIDAKASSIQIIITNAGKTLIQVIDNGIGMNEHDAKICFQKHTTSKIKNTQDIMNINTMGFRGEALASIASVSSVELKTKTQKDAIGTYINIENSEIKKQKKIALNTGTSISVKNLFFNIPARKNFLKSDKIEFKHILETFMQLAIVNYSVSFQFNNNGKIIYNLSSTNLKKRIIQLFGKRYNEKILPIEEKTSIVSIKGFLGNPIDAKKTRGEQFIYVNNRFIKSTYLNHAIKTSMDNIITKDQYPTFFIFLTVASSSLDVNIHPNKTEVKFEDDQSIYQILKSTCKKSIGMYNVRPSLDFTTESSFEIPAYIQKKIPREPTLTINKDFNPFFKSNTEKNDTHTQKNTLFLEEDYTQNLIIKDIINIDLNYAVFNIIVNHQSLLNIIDKQRALNRIAYEEAYHMLRNQKNTAQILTELEYININATDLTLLKEHKNILQKIGYHINKFTDRGVEIKAIPVGVRPSDIKDILDFFLEKLKNKDIDLTSEFIQQNARKITFNNYSNDQLSNLLSKDILKSLILKLFHCETPFIGIDGHPCVIELEPHKLFK